MAKKIANENVVNRLERSLTQFHEGLEIAKIGFIARQRMF